MVDGKGGPNALGLNGFLAQLVAWFTNDLERKSNSILERTCDSIAV
jgi:hypothetical protein